MKSAEEIRDLVALALVNISKHFVPDVKLTFVARLPSNDEADVVVTEDDLREAAKALVRCAEREAKR
jgi:hypothetical protein